MCHLPNARKKGYERFMKLSQHNQHFWETNNIIDSYFSYWWFQELKLLILIHTVSLSLSLYINEKWVNEITLYFQNVIFSYKLIVIMFSFKHFSFPHFLQYSSLFHIPIDFISSSFLDPLSYSPFFGSHIPP